MASEEEIARRLLVLQLAYQLGDAAEACRRCGISRSRFYEYRRRYQEFGPDGLRDRPPVHRTHPQTTPRPVVARIVRLALLNPAWGCRRLHAELMEEGVSVSWTTIQAILGKYELGTRSDRLFALERGEMGDPEALPPELLVQVERNNPCFAERHCWPNAPARPLVQDWAFLGTIDGWLPLYLNAVVDPYSGYAFGRLYVEPSREVGATVLARSALPFFRQLGYVRWVGEILTDHGWEFSGGRGHPYKQYLRRELIRHRKCRGRRRSPHPAIDRFVQIARDEFFGPVARQARGGPAGVYQEVFAEWLQHYNTVRPQRGFPNDGQTPAAVIADHERYIPRLRTSRDNRDVGQ